MDGRYEGVNFLKWEPYLFLKCESESRVFPIAKEKQVERVHNYYSIWRELRGNTWTWPGLIQYKRELSELRAWPKILLWSDHWWDVKNTDPLSLCNLSQVKRLRQNCESRRVKELVSFWYWSLIDSNIQRELDHGKEMIRQLKILLWFLKPSCRLNNFHVLSYNVRQTYNDTDYQSDNHNMPPFKHDRQPTDEEMWRMQETQSWRLRI
jgi:hypothetical protein